jgi:hypothetical protein
MFVNLPAGVQHAIPRFYTLLLDASRKDPWSS